MENIAEICNKFSTLKTKTKVQDKINTLDEYASDSDFCYLLEYLLNDDKITGIKKSKLKKDIKKKEKLKQQDYDSIKDLINYLLVHNTGSDQDVFTTQNFLNKITNTNERQIISDLITKDFKCGVTDLTAYGHIPGLERNWRERKGHSLVDAKTGELKIKKIIIQKQIFALSEKELLKEDYLQLLTAAKQKKNKRLYYIIQTICSTGIRVSEIKNITVDAINKGIANITNKGKVRNVFLPEKLCHQLKKYIKQNNIMIVTKFNYILA